MALSKLERINPPDSDFEAVEILELLLNADFCLQKAASSAMDAEAYTLSADLTNARTRIVEGIYSLIHNRNEIVELMAVPAQEQFKQFVDRNARRRNDEKS